MQKIKRIKEKMEENKKIIYEPIEIDYNLGVSEREIKRIKRNLTRYGNLFLTNNKDFPAVFILEAIRSLKLLSKFTEDIYLIVEKSDKKYFPKIIAQLKFIGT